MLGVEQAKVAKLTIESFKQSSRKDVATAPIAKHLEVQYNPSTLTLRHETVFQQQAGIATSSAQARFSHQRSKELSVKLVFDGTEVSGHRLSPSGAAAPGGNGSAEAVGHRIQEFMETCYEIKGEIHEPHYLKLTWNEGVFGAGFDCRLKSADITYSAFHHDGSPLRAELAAVFIEDVDPAKKAAKDRLSSPDVSHRRVVKCGDTLPLLCREIYGSPVHYLRVAAVNGLDEFRVLAPGQTLVFPPFERGGEGR